MVKILFVCHGNICRSPMGEYVLKDMVSRAGRGDEFEIASAAVSREELGNPVIPLPGGSLPATALPATAIAPDRSPRLTWMVTTMYSIWIPTMPEICGGCSPVKASGSRFLTEMWPIPGTPVTSPKPGRMSWKAANGS